MVMCRSRGRIDYKHMGGALGTKDRAGGGLAVRKAQGFVAALAVYAISLPLASPLLVSLALLPRPLVALWLLMNLLGPATAAIVALRQGGAARGLMAGRGGEPAQIVIRLLVPGVILVYLLGLAATGVEHARLLPLIALDVAATLYAWMLLAHLLLQPGRSSLRRWVAMLSDVGLVSMFLHFGAALSVPWFSLYFWIVLAFGVGPRALAAAAAATLTGFAAVYAATPYWQERPGLAAGVALALVLLPAHMANLLRRLTPGTALSRSLAPSGSAKAATRAAARSGPLDILLAENDDPRQSLRSMLAEAGHRVTVAASGDAAFSLLERRRFDLVLVDIELAGMSGCEMARLYRLEHLGDTRLPIIAIVADAAADTPARCRDAGIDAVLTPPFEAAALLAAIAATVTRLATPATADVARPMPPAGSSSERTVVLDDSVTAALRMLGGAEFVDEVADAFRVEARRRLEELRQSASAGDAAGFAWRVDSLYGSAANVGATRLCRALAMIRSVSADDLRDRGVGYVAILRRELDELEAALDALAPERHASPTGTYVNPLTRDATRGSA
jgi:CheY-like chemotaxis protein/HPt (histidine-containing phosphotransfer) domain-containing protein